MESFYETLGNYIRIDQECIIYGSLEKRRNVFVQNGPFLLCSLAICKYRTCQHYDR